MAPRDGSKLTVTAAARRVPYLRACTDWSAHLLAAIRPARFSACIGACEDGYASFLFARLKQKIVQVRYLPYISVFAEGGILKL